MKKIILGLLAVSLYAQTNTDGEKLVLVPQKYVSTEGLTHESPSNVSSWVGIGKEIGIATKEGLNSVVDVSEKFGTTNVGHFVMFMIAWKVLGTQFKAIVLGVPLLLFCFWVWLLSMRRFYWGRKVLVKVNADKSKEYKLEKYIWNGNDSDIGVGVAHIAAVAILIVFTGVIIFG